MKKRLAVAGMAIIGWFSIHIVFGEMTTIGNPWNKYDPLYENISVIVGYLVFILPCLSILFLERKWKNVLYLTLVSVLLFVIYTFNFKSMFSMSWEAMARPDVPAGYAFIILIYALWIHSSLIPMHLSRYKVPDTTKHGGFIIGCIGGATSVLFLSILMPMLEH